MNRKVYLGLGILMMILVSATVFVVIKDKAEIRKLEKDLVYAKKLVSEINKVKPNVVKSDEKPPDEPGFEWVKHNDHWDKIPINNADQVHGEPIDLSDISISEEVFAMDFDTDEYESLVKAYIDHHMHLYPHCKQQDALLKDAQNNAKWTLSNRKYNELSNLLDAESSQIDNELAMIYGGVSYSSWDGDMSHFLNNLKSMNESERKSITSKLNDLLTRSKASEVKTGLLYKNLVPYIEPSHTHE